MSERTNAELVDAVDDVLTATLTLVRELGDDAGELPTSCPGWNVRDQVAHMVGLEQVLHGAPDPTIDLPPMDHVSSELDVYMERHVQARRALPLSAVADELAGLAPRRIAALRLLAAEDGDPLVKGPVSDRPLSAALPVRVFDLWAHEQDIRAALGLDLRTECAAAALAIERTLQGWSAVLPDALGDVDADLVIRVTDRDPAETHIRLGKGGPTVTLTGDSGALTRVFCGRVQPVDRLDGDAALTTAITGALAVTP